ncbi:group I truncated hemoglobin [Nocardia aurea]|uniref:Group 1 truncated hemoglobin n=1 Tax=Nocardia aurea TaxID=2144174 RepID=A0ABV3FND7_9NOCA
MSSAASFASEPPTPEDTPIYELIGGRRAIEVVVEDFYARVLDDAALSEFFAGVNMSRMRGRQVEFFAAALGGPDPYIGPSMKQVHRGRGITRHHFDLVAHHLAAALSAAGVPAETTGRIIAAITPLADDIATGPAPDDPGDTTGIRQLR